MHRVITLGLDNQLVNRLRSVMGPATEFVDGAAHPQWMQDPDWAVLVLKASGAGPGWTDVLSALRKAEGERCRPVICCLEAARALEITALEATQLGIWRVLGSPAPFELLLHSLNLLLFRAPEVQHPRPATPAQPALLAGRMAELWAKYKEPALERVRLLEQTAGALGAGGLAEAAQNQARIAAHNLAGSVGTFGFAEASPMARQLETMLTGPADAIDPGRFSELLRHLRVTLEGQPAPAPAPKVGACEPVRLLIIDDDADLLQMLLSEAQHRGMEAAGVASVDEARARISESPPDAVILDLTFPEGTLVSLDLLNDLSNREPPIPVVVLTVCDGLQARVEVSRRGAGTFVQKPTGPQEVLDEVSLLLHRVGFRQHTILVVDDDPTFTGLLNEVLDNRSFHLVTLHDPRTFWETLERVRPDLLILDVDMPHLSGVELCRIVRNDSQWMNLPILFLTGHGDRDLVAQLFAAGADDFVRKPIIGPELVTRIKSRLERSTLQRMLSGEDGLTGLANRRKTAEELRRLVRMAARQHQSVSIALIDLDCFKCINDQHGHMAGDAVLRRLGALILRSFRLEDVTGRWGGEEMVVGLFGACASEARRRLEHLLHRFSQESFVGASGEAFQVTFSAGLAEYPQHGADVQSLLEAADAALYQAKDQGRNCVVIAP
ncbi:MAG TPA: diguanylate cyclase [Symbiobacteriaceae bacterium]|nr:diguanylate cyclase [Symbiobacteriaceae bacterium]